MFEDTFKIPIYGIIVKVVVCDDLPEYRKQIGDNRPSSKKGAIVYELFDSSEGFDLLVIFDYDSITERYCNHEAGHVTYKTLRYVGMSLSKSSEEAYTYLSDYVYSKLRMITYKAKMKKQEDVTAD